VQFAVVPQTLQLVSYDLLPVLGGGVVVAGGMPVSAYSWQAAKSRCDCSLDTLGLKYTFCAAAESNNYDRNEKIMQAYQLNSLF